VAQSNFAQVTVVGPDGNWTDLVHGSVVAAVGAKNFCAVATGDGHVLVYSPGGRRRSSPLCVGSGVASLVKSATANVLAVVSTSGTMRIIDVVDMRQLNRVELAPILEGRRTMVRVSLSSSSGTPLVVMSDDSAYVWDGKAACWVQVMDESSVISDFYLPLGLATDEFGEVTDLQSKARPALQAALLGTSNKTSNARYHVSRSHIEGNLAAAVTIGSTNEVTGFLNSYARLLVDSQDEFRLKELADELIDGRLTGDEDHDRKLLKDVVMPPMIDSLRSGGTLAKLVQRCQDIVDELA
jgi:protein HIRA/HIR1